MQKEIFEQMKRTSANFTNFKSSFLTCFISNSLLPTFFLSTLYLLLSTSLSFAQITYNLEIIFKRTNWNPDSILSYGYSLSTAGDLNQDDFDDIIYLVIYDSWEVKGFIYYGGC